MELCSYRNLTDGCPQLGVPQSTLRQHRSLCTAHLNPTLVLLFGTDCNSFRWPAGRWLLPIAHVDVGLSNLDEDGLLNLGVGLVAPWRVVKWRRVKWGTLNGARYCLE